MNAEFRQFLLSGKIREFIIGGSREDLKKHFGPPLSWVGRPPCFGEEILDPDKAEVIYYFDESIAFSGWSVIDLIKVRLEKLTSDNPLGVSEVPCIWRLGPFCEWLDSEGFNYEVHEVGGGSRIMGDCFEIVFRGFEEGEELSFFRHICSQARRFLEAN